MSFADKVVLITGKSLTLGYDYARYLLENDAKVALCDINNFERCRSVVNEYASVFGDRRVVALQCNGTDQNQLKNVFESCIRHFQKIDIIVNSACAFDAWMGDEDNTISDTNFECVVRGIILALQYMGVPLGGQGGTVVQIVSKPNEDAMIPEYLSLRRNVSAYTKAIAKSNEGNPTYRSIKFMTLCTDSLPDNVGRNFVHILEEGKTGDCWVSENGGLPTLEPNYQWMR
ncbi:Short-chain dehydrogenase/reductase SDR,NAD(P)-binding domain [Cinara cedri]|uniref:Short-chain dehydrogenase/reductase SDR,NAD(P)-binding domain n=1 Tax=Cinara cedri TaxID=506608 RepID=A0A5E4MN66_9HEMI|nr:Short-chain dehydrogenase/reductase SDR,NAD(P)-binding domain [Cinara cedri]